MKPAVDVSYLAPRDPSILGRNARPLPRTRRNLTFGEDLQDDTPCAVKVFLRIKPQDAVDFGPEVPSFKIVGTDTLLTRSWIRHKQVTQQFRFSAVLPERASQLDVFEAVARGPLQSLISGGRSGLLFTYGTTNAGKTHTMFGEDARPGLIPLSVNAIFAAVQGCLQPGATFKPTDGGNVIEQNEAAQIQEASRRSKLLEWDSKLGELTYSASMMGVSVAPPPPSTSPPVSGVRLSGPRAGVRVQVWVSCLELYSESLFDLLAPSRQPLAVHGAFVRGLTLVSVETAGQANHLLALGRHRLRSAATGLNACSSRSHCVFTVRLVYLFPQGPPASAQFDFVDLAGSERAGKTGNEGTRLLESAKINLSLSVLGRCLTALRANQRGGTEVVPFRDSLLTRLLRAPLLSAGGETVSLLVCAASDARTFPETCAALELGAVARKVTLKLPPRSRPAPSRFSLLANAAPAVPWAAMATTTAPPCAACRASEASFCLRLAEQEKQLRGQLCAKFEDMMNRMQQQHWETLKTQEHHLTEHVKWREERMLEKLAERASGNKRRRPDESPDSGSESEADTEEPLEEAVAAELAQQREEIQRLQQEAAQANFRAAHAEMKLQEALTAATTQPEADGVDALSTQLAGLLLKEAELTTLLDEARCDHLADRAEVNDLQAQLQAALEDAALKDIRLEEACVERDELQAVVVAWKEIPAAPVEQAPVEQAPVHDCKEASLELEVKKLLQQQISAQAELAQLREVNEDSLAQQVKKLLQQQISAQAELAQLREVNEDSLAQQALESKESQARAEAHFAQLEDLLRCERDKVERLHAQVQLHRREAQSLTAQIYRVTPTRVSQGNRAHRMRSASADDAAPKGTPAPAEKENQAPGPNQALLPAEPVLGACRPNTRSSKRIPRQTDRALTVAAATTDKKSMRKLFVQRDSLETPEFSPELPKARLRSRKK